MKLVVFGSNMIERAGLDIAETVRLHDEIFEGQEVEVDDHAVQIHIRHQHELKTWVCPMKICHRRFLTLEQTQ